MTILKIDSSITGENSVCRASSPPPSPTSSWPAIPTQRVVERDLVAEPLDHLTLGAFADTDVLDEFLAADTVVIGAPMYNFTVAEPAQGLDRPHRGRRQDLPLRRERPRGPGRRQAGDRRHLARRLLRRRQRASSMSKAYLRSAVQLHRHRARVRPCRRRQLRPRAARGGHRQRPGRGRAAGGLGLGRGGGRLSVKLGDRRRRELAEVRHRPRRWPPVSPVPSPKTS